MIINEPGGSRIRSDNVCNNEQASRVFFITHAEHNLVKLKLNNNQPKLFTVFWRVLCEIEANQSNFLTFEN